MEQYIGENTTETAAKVADEAISDVANSQTLTTSSSSFGQKVGDAATIVGGLLLIGAGAAAMKTLVIDPLGRYAKKKYVQLKEAHAAKMAAKAASADPVKKEAEQLKMDTEQ